MKKLMMILTVGAVAAAMTACQSTDTNTATTEEVATEAVVEEAKSDATETTETAAEVKEETTEDKVETEEPTGELPEGAPVEDFMPSDFLQEKALKDVFESYDEVISLLEKDNGYAYVKVKGYDAGDVLLITDYTYDNMDGNMATVEASVYAEVDGAVKNVGNIYSGGTAYPLQIEDGIIYHCGNHNYQSSCISPETNGVMYVEDIMQSFDEQGNASYTGFTRDADDLMAAEKDVDIKSDDEFYAMFEKLEGMEVINFTVVE